MLYYRIGILGIGPSGVLNAAQIYDHLIGQFRFAIFIKHNRQIRF